MPSRSNNFLPVLLLLGGALLSLGAKAKPVRFVAPVRGKVSSKFGSRDGHFHNGIDIAVPEGTNVLSIAPGVVSSSYVTESGGKQLVIAHDNGFRSGYAHLRFPLVKPGEQIEAGQLIAQSGKTGIGTGAHLHFTLRNPAGDFIDPVKYVRFG
jgi:murein DD-endopeptidase MepM/ murein hydrolase activator NlpD